ncbi:DnaJ domain-containing protein [Coniochaeta sp. 2T2.1]|nr:DnaJ domain-containing protein [Coniochaeta sp. 2T2.1]
MPPHPDHYAILGVPSTANPVEIRKAYHRLALIHHPDKKQATTSANPNDPAREFRLIHSAYEILSNPSRREAYDRKLSKAASASWSKSQSTTPDVGGGGTRAASGQKKTKNPAQQTQEDRMKKTRAENQAAAKRQAEAAREKNRRRAEEAAEMLARIRRARRAEKKKNG